MDDVTFQTSNSFIRQLVWYRYYACRHRRYNSRPPPPENSSHSSPPLQDVPYSTVARLPTEWEAYSYYYWRSIQWINN